MDSQIRERSLKTTFGSQWATKHKTWKIKYWKVGTNDLWSIFSCTGSGRYFLMFYCNIWTWFWDILKICYQFPSPNFSKLRKLATIEKQKSNLVIGSFESRRNTDTSPARRNPDTSPATLTFYLNFLFKINIP